MPKFIDLTGKTFNRLTALRRVECPSHLSPSQPYWLWQCSCGKQKVIASRNVRTGRSKSCGCGRSEHMKRVATKQHENCSGNYSKHPRTHASWWNMKHRCEFPSDQDWSNYGGRGITVCQRWSESFDSFIADVGPKPTRHHQIERIDNDKGYCPENCRWATVPEQARNRRNNIWLEYGGKSWVMADLARYLGISGPTLKGRVQRGWDKSEWGRSISDTNPKS